MYSHMHRTARCLSVLPVLYTVLHVLYTVLPVQGKGILEIALDPVTNRTGDMWHVCVHGLKNIGLMCYGWRADGDMTWESE